MKALKDLLKEKVWFPKINDQVKEMIDKCFTCQANRPENRPNASQMSALPPQPWHTVHVDQIYTCHFFHQVNY